MKKLNSKLYFIYSLGVSYAMIDQIYNQWIQFYYVPPIEEVSMRPILSPLMLSLAFLISRFIDAVADPVVGYLSDKSKSRFGRRSFFMAIGGLPLALSTILFFYPPLGNQYITFIYVALIGSSFFIAYTLVGAPYNTLVADLSETKEERVNMSTAQSIGRLLFIAIVMVGSPKMISYFGNGDTGYGIRVTVMILALISMVFTYISIFFLKENQFTQKEQNVQNALSFKESFKYLKNRNIILYFLGLFTFFSGFNLVRGIINYYVVSIMKVDVKIAGLLSILLFVASLLFFPATGYLAKKFNYKKIMIMDMILIIFGAIGLILFKHNTILIYIMFVIIGMGTSGAAFIFPPAMLSDISSELRSRENIRLDGFLFGIQGLFLKLAFLVQQVLFNVIIYFTGIDAGDGLYSASALSVYITIVITIVLLIFSIIFYYLKKEN